MVRARLLVALAVLATLAVPAAAHAEPKAKAHSPAGAAFAVGKAYWGTAPCGGQVKVQLRQRTANGVDAASDAWVTFDTPQGANVLAAPASTYTRCVISFGRTRWPDAGSLREDWDLFCATMVHEMGHLLGREHDLLPASVMVPVFTDVSGVPAGCRASRPARTSSASR